MTAGSCACLHAATHLPITFCTHKTVFFTVLRLAKQRLSLDPATKGETNQLGQELVNAKQSEKLKTDAAKQKAEKLKADIAKQEARKSKVIATQAG